MISLVKKTENGSKAGLVVFKESNIVLWEEVANSEIARVRVADVDSEIYVDKLELREAMISKGYGLEDIDNYKESGDVGIKGIIVIPTVSPNLDSLAFYETITPVLLKVSFLGVKKDYVVSKVKFEQMLIDLGELAEPTPTLY